MGLLLLVQMHYGWTRRYWHHHSVFCPQVERMAHIWLIVFYPWQWPTASLTRSFPFRTIEAGVKLPSMKCHKNRFGRKRPRWGNAPKGPAKCRLTSTLFSSKLYFCYSHIFSPFGKPGSLQKKPLLLVGMKTNTSHIRCKTYVWFPS